MYWLAMGWTVTGIFLSAILIGWFLDTIFQMQPWGILLFTLLGAVGSFFRIFIMLK